MKKKIFNKIYIILLLLLILLVCIVLPRPFININNNIEKFNDETKHICHVIWLQASDYKKTKKLIPSGIKKNYQKIIQLNKHINLNTWDNVDILKLINTNYPNYKNNYEKITDLRYKCDLARLFILYEYSGYYVDIDQESLLPFDNFGITNNTNLVLSRSVLTGDISNGFIYVKHKKDPFIKECIDAYISDLIKHNYSYTACKTMTDVVKKNEHLNMLMLREKNFKNEKDCDNVLDFYKSFYFLNENGDKLMRSRYDNFYTDKGITDEDKLVDFN